MYFHLPNLISRDFLSFFNSQKLRSPETSPGKKETLGTRLLYFPNCLKFYLKIFKSVFYWWQFVIQKNPVKTDPSFAIEETIRRKEKVDAFLIFAKSSSSKSYAEFKRYQTEVGENDVKLIICSMTANSSMIADPGDSSVREVCSGDANFVNEICKILEE